CAVHQYVEPPELAGGALHHREDGIAVTDVRLHGERPCAACPDLVADALGVLRAPGVVDRDVNALGGQRERDRPADAARAAGDEGRLAPQSRFHAGTVAVRGRSRLCSRMTLEGRTALVTGATGDGMGRSIALTLAREGAAVVLNYRSDSDRARRVVAAVELLGREALPYRADVSDAVEVDALFAAARERFGHVDIVVNSAGGSWKPQDLAQVPPGHFRRVLEEEVFATFLLLRAALPEMRDRGWGRFVSIGGHGADDWRFGPPQAPLDYPLGKAARHWLTRTVAPLEVAHGITVNA